MSFIYRDFNREYMEGSEDIHVPVNHFIGGIQVELGMDDHRIRLMVTGLQESGNAYFPLDYPCGQADLMVTIEPTIDLYDAIMTTMDKITADHQYYLRGNPYKDFVLCSNVLVQEHPELCYESNDQERCYMGGHWMPFTRESMAYVDREQEQEEMVIEEGIYSYLPEIGEIREDNDPPVTWKSITIHGEVKLDHDGHPVFTYDYPIISRDMGRKYYELTRGKRVCDITYTDMYPDNDENDQE